MYFRVTVEDDYHLPDTHGTLDSGLVYWAVDAKQEDGDIFVFCQPTGEPASVQDKVFETHLLLLTKGEYEKSDKPRITVCCGCTVGIINDDWTHLDGMYLADEADNRHASIQGTLELLGYMTPLRKAEVGCHRCPVCGDDAVGGHVFETETNK